MLLWLNEINEVYDLYNNEKLKPMLKVLKIISACLSFVYYMTDNIVWFAKIGMMSKYVPYSRLWTPTGKDMKWGYIKDNFSLAKTLLELFIFGYTYYLKK